MVTTKLEKHWSDFILMLACEQPDAYVQIRKLFNGYQLEIPFDEFDGISLGYENMGYSAGTAKQNQLNRNYLNEEEIARVRGTFIERMSKKQTCLTGRFGNAAKDSRSQGFCLQTFSLNWVAQPTEGKAGFILEIYYRSTEVTQKFLADLKWMYEVFFPILLEGLPIKPDLVRFRFCTLYLSSMFLPVALQRQNIPHFLTQLRDSDPKWFKTVQTSVSKWMVPECNYGYRARVKMHELWYAYIEPELKPQTRRKIAKLAEK